MDAQKRLILAAVLSFVFFAVYDALFLPKPDPTQKAAQEIQQQSAQSTPGSTTGAAPGNAPAAASNESAEVPAPTVAAQGETLATIKTNRGTVTIDRLGRVADYTLQGGVFHGEDNQGTKLFSPTRTRPLEMRFSDKALNEEAFKTAYTASAEAIDASTQNATLVLTQRLGATTVTKTLTFYPDGHYDLSVDLSADREFYVTPGYRPDVEVDMMAVHGALVLENDDTTTVIEDGDATGFESFRQAKIVSAFDRYYATFFYSFDAPFDVWINQVGEEDPLAFVKGGDGLQLSGYMGPKYVKKLEAIDPRLTHVVEYGMFTFMAAPLHNFLEFLHNLVGNWGWAIVIFTGLVRLVLYPLSAKGMISMHKLKELSPKLKEIQKKYKGEPQKLQMHMMEMYKKHNVNPMGGCLPFILQIPIFFAIYRVLINAIELKGTDWFYINDLSLMDPYYVLPILMGASMFFQQRITPQNFTDPVQEKVFKFLPLVFTFFFITFPAGLVLYWLANNIFSILQQWVINKQLAAKKALAANHEKD